MKLSVCGNNRLVFRVGIHGKTVGEYLIHNSALKPFGSGHALFVHGKLKQLPRLKAAQGSVEALYIAASVFAYKGKIIVVKSSILRSIHSRIDVEFLSVFFLLPLTFQINVFFLVPGAEHYQKTFGKLTVCGQIKGKGYGSFPFHCPKGGFIIGIEAIVNRSVHVIYSLRAFLCEAIKYMVILKHHRTKNSLYAVVNYF